MRVVGQACLDEFCQRHPDARSRVAAWLFEVKAAQWQTPSDIKARYASASLLADNRVVFNIRGNRYRLDAKISYKLQIIRIIRIGTHADYDHWEF